MTVKNLIGFSQQPLLPLLLGQFSFLSFASSIHVMKYDSAGGKTEKGVRPLLWSFVLVWYFCFLFLV